MSNDDLIKELMNNGKPTKYFVVKMYVEFTQHFTKLNGKVGFHDWFVRILILLLVTGLIGGLIKYFIF